MRGREQASTSVRLWYIDKTDTLPRLEPGGKRRTGTPAAAPLTIKIPTKLLSF
ncbi:MAG: hypothetical protein MUC60_02515 [Oscillatoria sp. Prado101]|nr:hypothetical protein [Oscillatoria sp. Prado101]